MTDRIPEDIARAARRVSDEMIDRWQDMGLMKYIPHIERDMAALAIARVIDAERRRGHKDETMPVYRASER